MWPELSKTVNLMRFRTLWTEVQRGRRASKCQVCNSDSGGLRILQFPFPAPVGATRWCEDAFRTWRMCCAYSSEHLGNDSCMTAAHWGVCWAWTTCEFRAGMRESSRLVTAFPHQSDSWVHCSHLGILGIQVIWSWQAALQFPWDLSFLLWACTLLLWPVP